MPRRLGQLFAGLVLYGVSSSMLLLAGLGVDPWDVLHQGLARRTGIPTGTWAIIAGAAVLLLWIPLRQRPGLGTLCNVVVVGAVIDLVLAVVTPPRSLPVQAAVMVSGVVLNGVTANQLQNLLTVRPGPNRNISFVDPSLLGSDGRANPQLLSPATTAGQWGQFVYLYGPKYVQADVSLIKKLSCRGGICDVPRIAKNVMAESGTARMVRMHFQEKDFVTLSLDRQRGSMESATRSV